MNDLAALEKRLKLLEQEFSGAAGRKRLKAVAVQTKKDVDEAVRADLGDQSMSGWRRKKPINIKGRFDIVAEHEFVVKPNVAGPMRVLEQGRNRGNVSNFQGPGVNPLLGTTARTKKSGRVRKVQARRAKRWNGYTSPKHTWSESVDLMQKRVGKRVDEQVQKSIAKFIKG